MRIIQPVTVAPGTLGGDTILSSSNVLETYTLWNSGTTYSTIGTEAALVSGNTATIYRSTRYGNLLLRSEELDNASWSKARATVTANAVTAPDGATTADQLIEDGTAANTHDIRQTLTKAAASLTYTVSFYVKAAGRTKCFIWLHDGTQANRAEVWFDLTAVQTGFAAAQGAGFTLDGYSIEPAGSGWYRCSLTATTNATASLGLLLGTASSMGVSAVNGDGVSGLYLWGLQVVPGAEAGSYTSTAGAASLNLNHSPDTSPLWWESVGQVPALWAAGTYSTGAVRMYNHRLYEVIATPSTADQPDIGAAADPPTWLDTGATNRWKMFDRIINSQTERAGTIAVEIEPGEVVNGLAMFGLTGSEVSVVMVDPAEGEVYSEAIPLQDNSLIIDWYAYLFEDIEQRSEIAVLNLPSYAGATITVTIDAGADTARCGELVLGRQKLIGDANFGSSVGIQSYSVKNTDDFGGVTIVPRAYAKRADYDVTIMTSRVAGVQKLLADVRDTPIVYIGDEDRAETILFGFFKSFNIVLANPTVSDCSIEVEGLT